MSNHRIKAELYATLRKACELAGGQSRWAEAHGISTGYLSDVLCSRKDPGPKLLDAIGWKRVTVTTFIPNPGSNG